MYGKGLSRLAALALLLTALAVCGCGKGRHANIVTGKVYVGDKVATGGTVLFLDAEGNVARTAIGKNGAYQVAGLAPGPAKVGVVGHAHVPPGLQTPVKGKPGGTPAEAAPEDGPVISARYADPEKSGLTYEVRSGKQDHDIELEGPRTTAQRP